MAQTDVTPHSFSDFPEDVQFCILSFLNPTEIANFACTSRNFSALCQTDSKLWYAICDRRWGNKTQINQWGKGKISYKVLYKILNKWEHLIGFWRRCGQSESNQQCPALIFFEWGPSFLSGYSVSPGGDGYGVVKRPFLSMSLSPEGQTLTYLDPSGEFDDLVAVSVNFIGDMHFSLEESLGFFYLRNSIEGSNDNSSSSSSASECGSPGGLPGTSDLYEYYANKMSPGSDKASRKQRRREKEKQGRKKWETEHFLKIVDCSPTPDRPLQGLWKGICDDMKLEFYLVAYDGAGISCRRVGDLSQRLSSSTPVFWTSNLAFLESPFSPDEDYLYNSRIHIRPSVTSKDIHWQCPLIDNEVVSRIMYINSSYDLVIPGLVETSLAC